jgi:hypothetical protein
MSSWACMPTTVRKSWRTEARHMLEIAHSESFTQLTKYWLALVLIHSRCMYVFPLTLPIVNLFALIDVIALLRSTYALYN